MVTYSKAGIMLRIYGHNHPLTQFTDTFSSWNAQTYIQAVLPRWIAGAPNHPLEGAQLGAQPQGIRLQSRPLPTSLAHGVPLVGGPLPLTNSTVLSSSFSTAPFLHGDGAVGEGGFPLGVKTSSFSSSGFPF